MRVLIGTGNQKKLAEIMRILADFDLEFLTPADLDPVPAAPDETGDTFEANAAEKALGYAQATGLWTIADDSGLQVDALDGRPGVWSARYAGENATDADNNKKLLEELSGVPASKRGGGYVSVVALASPTEVLLMTRGTCRGRLLEAGRGDGGFGYDPLFLVEELDRTFAEITHDEKARISHRGAALRDFRAQLPAILERTEHAS